MLGVREAIRGADPTAEQAATVAWVAETVAAWDRGDADLFEVRRRCSGEDRFDAARFTPPDDPAFGALLRCLDALIATDATSPDGWLYRTRMGVFSEAEIRRAGGTIDKDGRGVVLRFPGVRGVA